jgi:hypothetical protein
MIFQRQITVNSYHIFVYLSNMYVMLNTFFTFIKPSISPESTTSSTLLNDGAKRNHLLYLKIMYTAIKKILYMP